MDMREMHEPALDQTGQIVAGVSPEHLGLSTPCSEWEVQTLLGHMIGGNLNSAATAEGTAGPSSDQETTGESPAEAYRRSAEAVKRAWREPGRLDNMDEMLMGTLPGQAVLKVRLLETITHGWDLAHATGQTTAYDEDLVQAALQIAHPSLSGERPPAEVHHSGGGKAPPPGPRRSWP